MFLLFKENKIVNIHEIIKILIFVVCLFFSSCRSDTQSLVVIDDFLNAGKLDSAKIELNKINYSELSDEECAYYDLLRVKSSYLSYQQIESDTLINYSCSYYHKTKNLPKLSESLYYKGVLDYERGDISNAFLNLKKAEDFSKEIPDINIKHKIVEKLTDLNLRENEYKLALEYGLQNLKISSLTQNNDWLAYSYIFLAQAYRGLSNKKKFEEYLKKSMVYINAVPKAYRADFYVYIAGTMLPSQLEEAEEYVNIASKLSDNETIYGMKAQIAFIKGDYEQADSLWKCALCSNALDYNLSTLEMITNMYAVNHEYEKAYKASLKKDSVNTLINKKRLSDNALEVQKKYDFELQVLRFREKLNITIFVLIAIVLCTISLFVYSRYKANKATKDALENQMLINIYSKQLSQMKDSSKEKASEIDNLQNKISELNKKQSSILYEGKKLYDEIIGGGTVVLWGKNEFNHFIEYFKLIDLPFVVQLETEYMELSPRYKFFSILTHMGKSDDEIERIMGISYNTIRSTRTRIKMKKKCI